MSHPGTTAKRNVVFTLGAVSVVCACGLVIDPDRLVEGNASSGGPSAVEAGPADETGTGGSDAANDTSSDGNVVVVVPECVPEKSAGAQGPYAVVSAPTSGPAPVCPAGYLATPVEQGKRDPAADPPVCGDASCSCSGGSSGAVTCGLLVRSYNDAQCALKEADLPSAASASCGDLDSEQYYKLAYSVTGLTCTPSGSATTTSKPAPTYQTQYVVCAPDPSVTVAPCKDGQVPLPPASDADACVLVPMNQNCAGTSYPGTILLSKSGAFNDTRACACECQIGSAACTGGGASIYTGLSCNGAARALGFGTCTERNGDETVQQTSAPTPGPGPCAKRAAPTGGVQAAYDLKLCCLATGGG